MAAFRCQFQAIFFFFKFNAECYEASDCFWAFFDHEADGFFVVMVCAGLHSVLDVFFEIIVFTEDCGDASLCVVCVGFGYAFFCHDGYVTFLGGVQGKIEP